jgi:hypothetical protein
MAGREELLKAIREKRKQAARVRRIALQLSLIDDRELLMRQADELEKEARQLERQLPNDPTAPMQQQQQQIQQQQQQDPKPEELEPKPKPPKS